MVNVDARYPLEEPGPPARLVQLSGIVKVGKLKDKNFIFTMHKLLIELGIRMGPQSCGAH
jgi:hypothetical protein